MANPYVVVASVVLPILALCWLCCMACCIYRTLIKTLDKVGRTTKVQVIAYNSEQAPPIRHSHTSRSSSSNLTVVNNDDDVNDPDGLNLSRGSRGAPSYGPMFESSGSGGGSGDSGDPVYYPRFPQSAESSNRDEDGLHRSLNPMTPLAPPWPQLPPIHGATTGQSGRGTGGGNSSRGSNGNQQRQSSPPRRLPSSIRRFLEEHA